MVVEAKVNWCQSENDRVRIQLLSYKRHVVNGKEQMATSTSVLAQMTADYL